MRTRDYRYNNKKLVFWQMLKNQSVIVVQDAWAVSCIIFIIYYDLRIKSDKTNSEYLNIDAS